MATTGLWPVGVQGIRALAFTSLAIVGVGTSCKHGGDTTVQDASPAGSSAKTQSGQNATAVVDTAPDAYTCDAPDYGIYWYGKGNVAIKAVDGSANQFYSPTKPTVIYVHGWQNGDFKTGHRENFNLLRPDDGLTVDTAAAWIDAGWNIGIFYWQQFADEPDLKTAEAKIWSTQGPAGMRWHKCDDTFSTAGAPTVAMGEVFYQNYLMAMQNYTGPNIRIAGHSLGNQMAARLASQVAQGVASGQVPAALLPKRVALIDPFWTLGLNVDPLPGTLVRNIVATLAPQGMTFEWYKTSGLLNLAAAANQGDMNEQLISMIGVTKPMLNYVTNSNVTIQEGQRHVIAPRLYFWSYSFPVPKGCIDICNQKVPSAAMSDADVQTATSQAQIWLQTGGMATSTMADDVYALQDDDSGSP